MAEPRLAFRSRRGFALVTVLWLLTILCAVALEVSLFARLRIQATRNTGDGVRALFLARAGVERAVADLKAGGTGIVTLDELREDVERAYQNVEFGAGSYTLLADPRSGTSVEYDYGISDESAKVNLNTADAGVLSKVPGMDADLAADVVQLRQEFEKLHEVEDLLLIEAADMSVLFGEDQNANGVLDPNEDDGDGSWPPDNHDGRLDRGIAAYLTCCSATRNVTKEGKERVDINSASVDEITRSAQAITRQEAESIVEHRKTSRFSSIADLLDVKLVEKQADRRSDEGEDNARETSQRNRGERGNRPGGRSPEARRGGSTEGGARRGGSEQTGARTTSKNAFDTNRFKAIADLVTTSDQEVLEGLINLNTAPTEVIACLPGVDEDLAAQIDSVRADNPFESVGDLLDVAGMTTAKFKQLCGLVSVRSDVFSVRSFGVLGVGEGAGPAIARCVSVVIDRTGDSIELKAWRELH